MKEIINTHDQLVAAGGGIAICPAYSGAREMHRNGWNVYRVGEKGDRIATDPNAHWTDHGEKRFSEVEQTREQALEAAKRWVADTYGEHGPWKRNRMYDYVPERIAKAHPLRPRPRKTGGGV